MVSRNLDLCFCLRAVLSCGVVYNVLCFRTGIFTRACPVATHTAEPKFKRGLGLKALKQPIYGIPRDRIMHSQRSYLFVYLFVYLPLVSQGSQIV